MQLLLGDDKQARNDQRCTRNHAQGDDLAQNKPRQKHGHDDAFFNHLGEIRDRSFEQQHYRASGLNLVTAAIVLWNTVYLERAANALRGHGQTVEDALLQYLSPLGWEHISLTGDYLWRSSAKIGAGKYRPLRPLQPA